VQDSDLGINFFLDESCRGKSRAQCCAGLLMELNPDVQGDWWPKNQVGTTLCRFQRSSADMSCRSLVSLKSCSVARNSSA
jgi:NEDD8-activating enzyme E1 regulatory subunit